MFLTASVQVSTPWRIPSCLSDAVLFHCIVELFRLFFASPLHFAFVLLKTHKSKFISWLCSLCPFPFFLLQPREKGRMRFHRLQNVQIALDFLKQRQVWHPIIWYLCLYEVSICHHFAAWSPQISLVNILPHSKYYCNVQSAYAVVYVAVLGSLGLSYCSLWHLRSAYLPPHKCCIICCWNYLQTSANGHDVNDGLY